jgi:hypothetical protein
MLSAYRVCVQRGGDGAIDDAKFLGRDVSGNASVNAHRSVAGLASSLAVLGDSCDLDRKLCQLDQSISEQANPAVRLIPNSTTDWNYAASEAPRG